MPRAKKSPPANGTKTTPVSSVRHHATRANIPTEELRDFVADDEKAPKIVLYPRDPSLDPQLVWQGKDEQDRSPLQDKLLGHRAQGVRFSRTGLPKHQDVLAASQEAAVAQGLKLLLCGLRQA